MSPEFNLQVTNLLNRLLHLSEQSLELNDIGQFRINIFMLGMILLDKVFNDVLIPEDSKLLLQ